MRLDRLVPLPTPVQPPGRQGRPSAAPRTRRAGHRRSRRLRPLSPAIRPPMRVATATAARRRPRTRHHGLSSPPGGVYTAQTGIGVARPGEIAYRRASGQVQAEDRRQGAGVRRRDGERPLLVAGRPGRTAGADRGAGLAGRRRRPPDARGAGVGAAGAGGGRRRPRANRAAVADLLGVRCGARGAGLRRRGRRTGELAGRRRTGRHGHRSQRPRSSPSPRSRALRRRPTILGIAARSPRWSPARARARAVAAPRRC